MKKKTPAQLKKELMTSIGRRPRTGKVLPCDYCNKFTYIQPCFLGSKTHFCCREHHLAFLKKNAFNFPCKNCSKPVFTQPAQLKLRARSYCSLDCRRIHIRKLAEEKRRVLGYTKHQLDRLARYSPEAGKWRKNVFERDNYTCQNCLVRGTYLEADHIKPWAYFPDLRFELSNGRTLCRPCHDRTKLSAYSMRKIYAKKN